jgi:hypothetical protein
MSSLVTKSDRRNKIGSINFFHVQIADLYTNIQDEKTLTDLFCSLFFLKKIM